MESVTVNIYGESYTVRSDDDPDYVDEVARFVDEKMREIAATGKVVTTSKIAILAALNIADELLKERRDLRLREDARSEKIEQLLTALRGAMSE